MPRKQTRRGMLYSIGGTSAAVLGIGSVAASSERGPPDHANGRGNEDFDPHELDQIKGFQSILKNANESAREKLFERLDDEQLEALTDAVKPRYVTIDKTTTIEEDGDVEEISETEIRVVEENAGLAEKWDWDVDPIPETSEEKRDGDSISNSNANNTETPPEANAARVGFGQPSGELTGYVQSSGSLSGSVYENVDTTWSNYGGDGYTYRHRLSYDYSYDYVYGTSVNEEISNASSYGYATYTDWQWDYDGEVSSDVTIVKDSDGNERVYATQIGKFEWVGPYGLGDQQALIELKGVRAHVSVINKDPNL